MTNTDPVENFDWWRDMYDQFNRDLFDEEFGDLITWDQDAENVSNKHSRFRNLPGYDGGQPQFNNRL